MNKVVLFADATCDLNEEFSKRYNIHFNAGGITLDGKEYIDNVTITSDEIFKAYREKKLLPKTSAINTETYLESYKPWLDDGYEVVQISLSSGVSACNQNAVIASKEREGIYVVDTKSLSTGFGHLVIEAGELIQQGLSGKEVAEKVTALVPKVRTSFILDTLEFMHAGGRCSSLAAFGANLLGLKPCLEINTNTGNLEVVKKYRGSLEKVLREYVRDQLTNNKKIRTDKIFITYSTISPEILSMVRDMIEETIHFENIYEAPTSCNISSHCGPNTLGILFMTE